MAQRLTPISISGKSIVLDNVRWTEHAYSQGTNLPTPPTPLIGREQERAWAIATLTHPDNRLLTMFGMGGVGKTRLSIAIGVDLFDHFPDGVFFIPLQNITEGGLLPSAISQALEIYTLPGDSALQALISSMRDMNALLILDNFEQLVSSAPVLSNILSACPHVKMLVTSREVLNLRGEQELLLQPLPLPSLQHTRGDIAAIESSPAVKLFVQRASSVKPNFALDSSNADAVAEICARLDGLPLAIELAAARIRFLSPPAIVARLQKRMQLLTGGAQDLPERQQTLRNVIDWSYDLLSVEEKRLFRLLSVFSGCTLDAAQDVCDDLAENPDPTIAKAYSIDVLNLATSLANKSLVRIVENDGDQPHLVMLETVREYAGNLMSASPEVDEARAAHARFVAALAQDAEVRMKSPEQPLMLNKLERELGNIRYALEWSAEKNSDGVADFRRLDIGLAIAGSLSRFWVARGHLQEGREWFALLLPLASSLRTPNYTRALRIAGRMEFLLSSLDLSRDYYQEALDIARELNNDQDLALALLGIGNVVWESSYNDLALGPYKECLEIWTRLGYKPGIASVSNNIGLVLTHINPESARPYLERSIQIYREQGDMEGLAISLDCLGQVYLKLGDLAGTESCELEALALNLEIDDQWSISYDLSTMARLAAARKDYARSILCLSAANAGYEEFTGRLEKYDLKDYKECLAAGKAALGEAEFNTIWAEGQKIAPREILQSFITSSSLPEQSKPTPAPERKPPPMQDVGLSTRETEVLSLLAQGFSNAEVAEKLFLSLYTVNAHLRNIYGKLNVSSRSAATRFAVENGIA